MNRRRFLSALFAAPVATYAAIKAKIAPVAASTLDLEAFTARYLAPAAENMARSIDLRLQYKYNYELATGFYASRFDVLYGVAPMRPDMIIRETDESAMQLRFDPARLPA